ncbi:MAG: hypothetical protein J5787_04585 [Alphaproteobacteria bacterium]|nr:hypothetical protein [Alphaproteobacteria bacterium]
MSKKFVSFFLILFLAACGHTGREHAAMIEAVRNGDFESAQKITTNEDFYMDKPSLLVRYVELGTLHYVKGEYYQALMNFDKAHALSKELYTTSVSKSVAAQIVGDGVSPYAGERYELSLLRFYQSLTHYRLYEQGFYESYTVKTDKKGSDGEILEKIIERKELTESEKKRHFNAARASILDWNSLLTSYLNESGDKKIFKQDMLAKTYGAEIHDIYGSGGDKQIARQLYKDAQKLLNSVYADYEAYSAGQKKKLTEFAVHKGEDLKASPVKKENAKFILKTGIITPKIADKVDFNIPLSAFVAAGSKNDLADCLGMILPGQKISFEIPSMEKPAKVKDYRLVVKNGEGAVLTTKDMILTAPVSETAYKEFQRQRGGLIAKKGTRLTSKYVTAVIAACAIYKRDDIGSWLAAWAAFAASSKLIEESEYADLRYWGLLPHAVYQQSVTLKPGKYTGEIRSNDNVVKTFTFTVPKDRPTLIDVTLLKE